jgi:hypothetical protein
VLYSLFVVNRTSFIKKKKKKKNILASLKGLVSGSGKSGK